MEPALVAWRKATIVLLALVICQLFTAAPRRVAAAPQTSKPASAAPLNIPKLWHSEASGRDFRVQLTSDLFRAEWVNLPPAAAKMGAYIRTECRRSGTRWVGSSSVYQPVAVAAGGSSAPNIKMCHLTVRFEVDSVTPQRITYHSEAWRNFDPAACRLLQTAWKEFYWIPKK